MLDRSVFQKCSGQARVVDYDGKKRLQYVQISLKPIDYKINI